MKIKLFGKEIFFSAIIICIFSAIPIRTFLRIWKNTLGTWFWIISFKSHNGGQGLVFFQFLHFWWYEPSILDNKCLKGSSYEENVKKIWDVGYHTRGFLAYSFSCRYSWEDGIDGQTFWCLDAQRLNIVRLLNSIRIEELIENHLWIQ